MIGSGYDKYCACIDVKLRNISDKSLIRLINMLNEDINRLSNEEDFLQNEYERRFGIRYKSNYNFEDDKIIKTR